MVMGDELEIHVDGVCDAENTIYVAVGKNVKEGKSLLKWAMESFEGKSICLLHVHQPTHLVALMDEKLSTSKLKQLTVKAYQDLEWQKMQKLLDEYSLFLSQSGIQTGKVWVEMSYIEKGIIEIIVQCGIQWLVMGAAAEKFYKRNLSAIKSSKALHVCQKAPPSCHIWFACKGCLIYTRPGNTTTRALFASVANEVLAPQQDDTESTDDEADSFHYLDHSDRSVDEVIGTFNFTSSMMAEMTEDGSPLHANRSLEYVPQSSSVIVLDQGLESRDIPKDLEHAMLDAENSKQRAFEEWVRRWRAEEDALEAAHKAETSEELYTKEMNQRKEMEESLVKQRCEIERMNNQRDQSLKELCTIREQKPELESQIRESYFAEKELEEKIIQAVNLLVTFREKRDHLQIERDCAIREVHKLKTLVKEDPTGLCNSELFSLSFSEIIEATQDFDPSRRIGEGRYGTVYKGILHHRNVAIKMLPSCGSLSDSEFKHEAEILSRVRHPNLVTIVGVCPASRSLVYEYVENGSLEDHLSRRAKARPLSWQSRIKIATEICSALIFLHANNNCIIHRSLKPSNILLNSNFVSKVSDFGIHHLVSRNYSPLKDSSTKNDEETSVFLDPEFVENGEAAPESDIYSFGIVLLQLLTARPASGVVKDVKCAIGNGHIDKVLDFSAGEWPVEQAEQLANLALRCCEKKRLNRPDLISEVLSLLEPIRDSCTSSCSTSSSPLSAAKSHRRVPSHFVCPIFQEIMKDPHIAADGFTYEGDAIKGWLNSGHQTSPMTNLKLEHCDLLPNYALYYTIQEWQQQS